MTRFVAMWIMSIGSAAEATNQLMPGGWSGNRFSDPRKQGIVALNAPVRLAMAGCPQNQADDNKEDGGGDGEKQHRVSLSEPTANDGQASGQRRVAH